MRIGSLKPKYKKHDHLNVKKRDCVELVAQFNIALG